ncbi:MAG: hypothetical protein DRZ79_00605, partial [Candidatus Cloacimonadota bacterium]
KKTEKFRHPDKGLENIAEQQNNSEQQEKLNKIISSCMQKLKPEQAFILELQFFQKKSYKEIAEILETSESAVDSKLVRAKRKLRKIVSSELSKLSDDYKNELFW